jgi:hypothetical protein
MGKYALTVNITPEETAAFLKDYGFADLIHEDYISAGESKRIITLIFEKYFMRVEGRTGITVIIENTSGVTDVRVITAGVGRGMIFSFDWGASDSMIDDIKRCLNQYILEERELKQI